MKAYMKKAVFFDIDGTLIHSLNGIKEIRTAVKDAIQMIQKNGDYVFIATGRPYAFLNKELLSIGFDGFVLANGAHVILNGEDIYKDTMDKKFVKDIISVFDEHEIQYILEGEYKSYLKAEFKEMNHVYQELGIMNNMLESNYELDQINVYKVEMLCSTPEKEQICLDIIAKNPEYDHYHSINDRWFELYPKKNTKATGILKILERLQIPVEYSYAFGDGKNDIEMLSTVGCGIAMGNAEEYVKQHADAVTKTVHEDGVAEGIYKYVLTTA